MRLRGLTKRQKWILNLLYDLRNTTMAPPDPRLSIQGIAKIFGIRVEDAIKELDVLKEKAYVQPFKVGFEDFCKITRLGIAIVEKRSEIRVEGEMSTSKIGVKAVRQKTIG